MKKKIQNHFNGDYTSFYSKYLEKVQKIGGDEFKAICPFHEDSNPSFNFNNQTGKYYCHGCGKKGDIFHFYSKINGMDTKRDFRKILKGIADDFGIPWEQQKSRVVAKYDYIDSEGNLLFQVCRMEPKSFRQRRPDGKGGWIWNLKGIEPVLYRLLEVAKADEVIIVEGEKDCDNLTKLNFVATTCPMGAKKWRDEYSEYLKGKRVVLLPDNDNEGKEHMVQIGVSLKGKTANLKLIELPSLPNKGDVTDFIESFEDPEEANERLSILIENAEPYEPPKKYGYEDVICEVSAFREIKTIERKCLLFPWAKEESIGEIFGWRAVGKTFFALGIVNAITKGENFGPWESIASVPCLFVDAEMTKADQDERIDDLNLLSSRKSPFYIYSDYYANQLGLPRARLTNETWRRKMKSILVARGIKLWILDNIASLAPGIDENSKKDWDPFNQYFLELRFAGISTLFLHHESKEGKQRGTSAREDNLDYSIRLKHPSDYVPEDGCRFIANFTKARVRTRDLNLISDIEFKFITDESGKSLWTYSNVKGAHKREVLKMLDEGFSQQAICENLDLSKGYVSKIRKRALDEGLITPKNQLTQEGSLWVNSNEN